MTRPYRCRSSTTPSPSRFRPLRRQLEHRTGGVSAAVAGRAVEIAGGIEDQAGDGDSPVRAAAVKLCSTFSVQVPPAAGVNSNTVPQCCKCRLGGRAVEIAGGIEDQAGVRDNAPSVPLPKLCSTFSVQPARGGVNSNTVP